MASILYPVLVEPILPPSQQPDQRNESRWHQPFSTPVLRVALTAAVIASSGAVQSPTLPSLSLLWQQPLSQPGAAKPSIPSGATLAPTPPAAIEWFVALSQPTVRPATQQTPPGLVYAPASAEVITLDKWYQPLSGPRFPNGLPTAAQPYFSFAKAAPFAETVTADRWFQPLNQPLTRGAAPFVAEIGPVFVSASVEWFQPLSIPRARAPSQYQALSYGYFVASAAPETITLDKWYAPLSLPVRYQRSAEYPALSYSYAIVSPVPPATDENRSIMGQIITVSLMGR